MKYLILAVTLTSSFSYAGKILSCHDGDTCKMQQGSEVITIRLAGIDAPEIKQSNGPSAQRYLESLVKGKDVNLQCKGKSYKRKVCGLFLGSTDVQKEMVRAGWAFDYPQYSHRKYKADEEVARLANKGVWASNNIKSPFCFRHRKVKKCLSNLLFQP